MAGENKLVGVHNRVEGEPVVDRVAEHHSMEGRVVIRRVAPSEAAFVHSFVAAPGDYSTPDFGTIVVG